MRKRLGLLTACVMAATSPLAHAEGIRWNGYVNIVAGGLQYDPRSDDTNKKQHPGFLTYEQTPNYDTQSSAALQASKDLDAKSSITTQLFASGENGDYAAKVKWLYLTYNLNSNSTIRVGRIGNPAYFFSDFFNVGYAYHWISPPNEVYSYDTTQTGLDYIYRGSVGDSDWSVELFTGGADQSLPTAQNAKVKSRNIVGGVLSLSSGWLSLRAMVEHATVTLDIPQLSADYVLDQLPIDASIVPGLTDRVTDTLDLKDAKATYVGLAAKAEFEHWLLMAETTYAKPDRYVMGDHTLSSFVSAGWKFNRRFMTHLTYGQTKETLADDAYDDLDYVATHSAGLSSDYIAASLNSQVAMSVAQNRKSWTLGTRYDLSSNIALKFDVIQFEEKASYQTETMGIGKNVMLRAAMNAVY